MKEILEIGNLVERSDFIICVKDSAGKVLFQNGACLKLCGEMYKEDSVCDKNCMLRYVRDIECPDREEGTQYFPCQLIDDNYYDIFFMNTGESLVSILYPLKSRLETDLKYFTQFKELTKKETEIVSLILKKVVNREICLKLEIKKDTLKSHLKNIYQKLPAEAQAKLKLRSQ